MDVVEARNVGSEVGASTSYETSTTVEDSDDEVSNTNNGHFVTPTANQLTLKSIRIEQTYKDLVKPFQDQLIKIKLEGTQEDLLNLLDSFWERLFDERETCRKKLKSNRCLTRRINNFLLSVRDINNKFVYNPTYYIKLSRILAFYMDLVLRASNKGKDSGAKLGERLHLIICSHLKSSNNCHDNEYVLLMFVHMEKFSVSHKELVDVFFKRFILPKTELFEPKVYPDRMYITYLVLYKRYMDFFNTEKDIGERMSLIDMAKKHIQPAQTLRHNKKYAPYLPMYIANENPTEKFLLMNIKFNMLVTALKVPDIEDNRGMEIIDLQDNMPNLQLEEKQSNDSTTTITKSMSSTSITNAVSGDQVNSTKFDNPKRSNLFSGRITSSYMPCTDKTNKPGYSLFVQPKREPDEFFINEDGVIDLTVDEIDVRDIDDSNLSWISIIEPKVKRSLMLPPQNYGPRRVSDKIIVIDDDDDENDKDDGKKSKPNIDSENSSDSNLCSFLDKTQSFEISTKNNNSGAGSAENTISTYSVTSPTDSGIIMTNSGRNTVCSLYDEELTDCGLISNDEHEPKSNKASSNKTATAKINLTDTDTGLATETDKEIENLTPKNSQVMVSTHNSDSQLVNNNNSNVNKLKDNCDEIVVNRQNNELIETNEPEWFENMAGDLGDLDQSNELRCGPITKTYQSNKKPRPRILTPSLDIANAMTMPGSTLISPSKPEITLDDGSTVSKSSKTQMNKVAQSSNSSSSGINTIVFSMLPRQKPNISSHLPIIPTKSITNSNTSNNPVFSTINPNTVAESSKYVSSSIIRDWAKTCDDDIFKTDCGNDTDIEDDDDTPPPSDILIRCEYFKSEAKSSPFSSTRSSSPYSSPQTVINTGERIQSSLSKNTIGGNNVLTSLKSPATGSLPFFNLLEYYSIEGPETPNQSPSRIMSPSRNKRVAFANSVVEYKTEKVEDEPNNLKLRFRKKQTLSKQPAKKSILKKLPKLVPCSILLKKLPRSGGHNEEYLNLKDDGKPDRVASILIRRNNTRSTITKPSDKDSGYTVWRRDYTTDYDEAQTEQRKSHKKNKSKRKRSHSCSERQTTAKKQRKQNEFNPLSSTQQLHVVVKPLNLNQLDGDSQMCIENEIEFANGVENVADPEDNIATDNIIQMKFGSGVEMTTEKEDNNIEVDNSLETGANSIVAVESDNVVDMEVDNNAEIQVENYVQIEADDDAGIQTEHNAEIAADNNTEIQAENYVQIEADEDAEIQTEHNAEIAADNNTEIQAENYVQIEADDDAKIQTEHNAEIAADTENYVQIEADDDAGIQTEHNAEIAADNNTEIQAENYVQIEADDDAEIQTEHNAAIAADNNTEIQAENYVQIEADDDAKIQTEHNAEIAADNNTEIQAENYVQIEADDDAKIQTDHNAEIAADTEIQAENYVQIEADDDAEIQTEHNAEIAADNNTEIQAENYVQMEADDDAEIQTEHNAAIAADNNTEIQAENYVQIEADDDAEIQTEHNAEIAADNNTEIQADGNAEIAANNAEIENDSIVEIEADIGIELEAGNDEIETENNVVVHADNFDLNSDKKVIPPHTSIVESWTTCYEQIDSEMPKPDTQSSVVESWVTYDDEITPEEPTSGSDTLNNSLDENEITKDKDLEDEMNIDPQINDDELLNDVETEISCEPASESQISDEITIRFTPEPNPNDDESLVSTTNDIQEESETEIEESITEQEIIQDSITSPSDEELQTESIEASENVMDESINASEEIIISQTPECDGEVQIHLSSTSEEILDMNKIMSENNEEASEAFLDRINVSDCSEEYILPDTNIPVSDNPIELPKTVEQLTTIDRMLSKRPAKILKANSCLDQISKSLHSTKSAGSKNVKRKNGRATIPDRSTTSKNIIAAKSSPTTSSEEEEYLMEEYLDDDEMVSATVELNNRSEGDQSCTSEEIPSPPFETVVSNEKVNVVSKKFKIEATTNSHSNEDVPIESPPFDEVLDLKSFGTLENDSSISEMENVGKRVNDNFNEIDDEEEITPSENELDLNADIESSNLTDNQKKAANQNDVTTTTLSLIQKKKNLVHRPYNRHIKINNKKRNSNSSSSDIPETIVSSTTITTNQLVPISNQMEFNGTNNSSTSYNLLYQLNHEDYTMKKRRGRPKGSKNKRKDIVPPIVTTLRSETFHYTQLSPPPPLKPASRRQSIYYQHHEIASSSVPHSMLFNNNPPYRPPYNPSEESLNQINRNRPLPSLPFNRNHRFNLRTSCDSDEQPLIYYKQNHHHNNKYQNINATTNNSHGYDRKSRKLKRNDTKSPQFSLEKPFGLDKDLMDSKKTYLKIQDARTIFVPEDIDKLIQNQPTSVDHNIMASSPITSTYHRYDPGGGGGINNNIAGNNNCANYILNNSNSSNSSDPITQSHQFVNYDTSSSPERILTQHEHNYSNDSFPHQMPQPLLNTSSLDYLHLPYLLTAQQQFKTPLQYIHR